MCRSMGLRRCPPDLCGRHEDRIDAVLDGLAQAGIRSVLALRATCPKGMSFPGEEHFRYAAELIAAIRSRGAFCVGAACIRRTPESPRPGYRSGLSAPQAGC